MVRRVVSRRQALRSRVLAVTLVTGLGLTLAGCGGDSGGGETVSEASTAQKALYKEAVAAGGKVSFFVGTGSNEETDMLEEAFTEQFPDVSIDYVSGTGDEVTERLLTEKRSGLNNADVFAAGGLSAFSRLDEEGILEKFTPEDADLFTQEKTTFIDGLAYGFADIYNSVCFNPANVSKEEQELLTTYEGWTDPVWKGRAAIVNPDGFGYRFGLTHWVYQDPDLGKEWLTGLAKLRPTVYASAGTAVPQVIAGEHDVVFNAVSPYGARAHKEGAPLQCGYGEYAPYYTFTGALVKDAPNEAAGKLLINWLMSEDGQLAIQESYAWSARREGMDAPVVDAEWWKIPEDRRATDEALVDENYSDLVSTFNDEFAKAAE